jgi:hypothetical protein
MKGRIVILIAALFATGAIGGRAADLVEIRINGHYFSEPATIRLVVAVEPDKDNRTLRIEADGERLYRSTEFSLDGSLEKRLHNVEFKNLPAGAYELRAEVLSANQVRAMATQELMVMGVEREK